MTRRILIFLFSGMLALWVFQAAAASDAGRETPFSLGAGARSVGMGAGFTSLTSDATAVYYNPAGLAYLDYQEISLMHSALFEGTIYNVASWVFPMSPGNGVGVGYMRVGTGEITRRENYASRGEFSYSHWQFILSYGHHFGRPFGIGLSLKIVNQSLDNLSDFGLGLDVGLRSTIWKHLSLGVIARDIVPADLELNGVVEETPGSVAGGISLADVTLFDRTAVSLALDLEKFEDRDWKVHAGGEVEFRRALALRFGYDRDNLTFGVGLSTGRLRFDYAYKLLDYIDNTHHVSMSILLGESLSEQAANARLTVPAPPPLTEEQRVLLHLKETANRYFRQFKLDSALAFYRRCYELDSTDEEVASSIPAIEQALRLQVEREGKLRDAEEDLQQYMRNFYARAQLLYARGFYSAALDLLDLIFDTEPNNAQALWLKRLVEQGREAEIETRLDSARAAVEDGRIVAAIETYNRVLELDPGNQEVMDARQTALASLDIPQQLNLGIDLFEKGRTAEARRRFEAVLRIRPEEPVALEYLNKIEKAVTEEKEPVAPVDLQKDPVAWQHYLNGLRYMRNSEYQKAIDEWQRVLEIYPDEPNTLSNIEQARLRLETE
ncbi:MAG TPA: PorV/PorQ family protein [Acidobacteriota bacterium]|nr:PorV/PorQ family protein [Acidobacteriota bacterium]